MSDVEDAVPSFPGYLLSEEAHYRLEQLCDHLRFLARLAQPRTPGELKQRQPAVHFDELAFCLELLTEHLTQALALALAQVQWPARLEVNLVSTHFQR
ncbi:hypothetical protein XBLMG947_3924 [Xanthomonas bromi]|uniref:XAC0095-like domain-containing protein n=1 Tax=Xanthomonas bromi TaxID=56449 RepID=A0A1C3NRU4_9XANT|nr:hypothetical protein [Xanthomonas bromi]PPV04884.1 hypothetical protein XbrCFBP1976_20040 [Xanthomonas bromi]SBV53120.1 hypothetical protein XBLMG947_3924 [Xanthomonas bromi]